ncbi:hypothetical protein [Saccharopolyspora flava]|uniref:HNH endonuclease n=1 Tax=Saccharopolyspora flava TaxID=95161 RepID=A0A1I6SCK4_9PSEU|nr:hypothetical protein [Saccharopolyspora flava]SFS74691.1 hypothetical protein SAMN05660874_03096 [Saccharopolyspora flava]
MNHNGRKARCPRGHLLVPPNLVTASAKRGLRACLACHRARRVKNYRGWSEDHFIADAHRRYAALLLNNATTP